jgi:hypothetical protein
MIDVVSASNALCMIWPEYCADQLMSGLMQELQFHHPSLQQAVYAGRSGISQRRQNRRTEETFWRTCRRLA